MPTGTPRGFNLSTVPVGLGNNNGPMAGGVHNLPSSTGGMPGFVNAGSWAGNGMAMANAAATGSGQSALHNPGVIRRGGRHGGARSGPYDRRGGRGGHGPGMNGRLSPVRMFGAGGRMPHNAAAAYIPPGHPAAAAAGLAAGGIAPGGGRWGDNAGGGAQAMGPKEAVQGRILKSYEDLDAVGGPGSGELNY